MIVVVTGASGAGKSTVVRALDARGIDGVRCFFFDSVGVPEDADEAWRVRTTAGWLARLDALDGAIRVAVLDGQVPPTTVIDLARGLRRRVRVILLECAREVRDARLRERGQPELASDAMACWAAYLRGQADALKLDVVDTTGLTIDEVADRLANEILSATVESAP